MIHITPMLSTVRVICNMRVVSLRHPFLANRVFRTKNEMLIF